MNMIYYFIIYFYFRKPMDKKQIDVDKFSLSLDYFCWFLKVVSKIFLLGFLDQTLFI